MTHDKLVVTMGPHLTWRQGFHLHRFRLKFATFTHHYEQCRCGTRRARGVGYKRTEFPQFVEWLEGREA